MKKSILLGLGAVAMAMGVGAGLAINGFEGPAEAKANGTRTVYVILGANSKWWTTDSRLAGVPACHYWGGVAEGNQPGVYVAASGIENLYSFEIPSAATNCLFAAWDGSIIWDSYHEQTVDLSLTEANDLFTIDNESEPKYNGYWSKLPDLSSGTIYFVDGESWHLEHSVKAHYWGGESASAWPGVAVNGTEVRLAAKLGGNEVETENLHVYKFTLPTPARYVIFNNDGNGGQTGNLAIEAGKVYYSSNVANPSSYDALVKLLLTINDNMDSAAISVLGGEIKSNTICAIDVDLAEDIIDDYKSLDAGIATAVAKSGIETYTKASGYTLKDTAYLSGIVDALADKYNLSNGGVNAWSVTGIGKKDASLGIGLVAAFGALAAGTMVFLAKKRKEN